MPARRHPADYEQLSPPGAARAPEWGVSNPARAFEAQAVEHQQAVEHHKDDKPWAESQPVVGGRNGGGGAPAPAPDAKRLRLFKRGHTLSYVGVFLFTVTLYFRPYELFPALASLEKLAFYLAIVTLLVFLPSQFGLEGNLTARPREVNLVLLLCLAGLLSIPGAISPGEAWGEFNDVFIKAVLMFIVMINVVRTERRLRWLMYITLGVTLLLSYNAIQDYRSAKFFVEGYRIKGVLGGMFSNPNDLALHFVTMAPLAFGLMMVSRSIFAKFMYGALTVLTIAANIVTYSRGGFLGLLAVAAVLIWKLGRGKRLSAALLALVCIVPVMLFAPGNYGVRLLSILVPSLDPVASASARRDILGRSIMVSLRHPLFGVGMGNFHIMSLHETVTHNVFTQVSSEMGTAALIVYMMFLTKPIGRMRRIERETFATRRDARYYYLAVGLQASLIGYMVSGFFAAVAYQWYAFYLVAYAVCLARMYQSSVATVTPAPDAPGAEHGVSPQYVASY